MTKSTVCAAIHLYYKKTTLLVKKFSLSIKGFWYMFRDLSLGYNKWEKLLRINYIY